jgi:hypothetical protein
MTTTKVKDEVVNLNRPQWNVAMNMHQLRNFTGFWGRGTGKSSIFSIFMDRIVNTMQRSNWAIQGATFQQLLTRTLPGTLAFMEKLGYRRDKEIFIRSLPDRKMMRYLSLPHEHGLIPENSIYILDRSRKYLSAFTLLSQDRSSSRGLSMDGVLGDEMLLINQEKLSTETLATLRGHREYYGHLPLHHGKIFFSSRPLGQHWLDKDGHYLYQHYDYRSLLNEIADLQYEFCSTTRRNERLELWQQIDELNKKVRFPISKSGHLYSEYSSFDNIENLGLQYILDQKESMTPLLFKVEMLNKKVTQIEGSFYPLLSREKHGYKGLYNYSYLDNLNYDFEKIADINSLHDLDCDKDKPLDVGLDFGTDINWWIVGQEIKEANQFNFIKEFHVKTPRNIDDVAKEFCKYYRYHKRKLIYLWPDGEGNQRRANTPGQESYVNQLKRILYAHGWSVNVMKRIQYNTPHKDTYMTWARCLAENNANFPKIRFNLINCKDLVYSMEQTPAIDHGSGDIRKDKSSEKRLKHNREEATDAGDAADQIIFGKYGSRNSNSGKVRDPIS